MATKNDDRVGRIKYLYLSRVYLCWETNNLIRKWCDFLALVTALNSISIENQVIKSHY